MNEIKLGTIPNAWKYSDDVSQIAFKDSVEVYNFFRQKIGVEGLVILAFCKVNHPYLDHILCWIYIHEHNGNKAAALAAVFFDDIDLLKHVIPGEFDIRDNFTEYHTDGIYDAVVTSTSEVAIRKVRYLLDEEKAKSAFENSGHVVDDIYPVEVRDPKTKSTVHVCWSITLKGEPDIKNWLKVSVEDGDYPVGTCKADGTNNAGWHEIPIPTNKKVLINGETFILKSGKIKGRYFVPQQMETELKIEANIKNVMHFVTTKNKYPS